LSIHYHQENNLKFQKQYPVVMCLCTLNSALCTSSSQVRKSHLPVEKVPTR